MRHIKKYEELDFSKLNPFSLFKGGKPSSVNDIIKDLKLELIGTTNTKFKDKEYINYVIKIPSSSSIMVSGNKLILEGAYIILRIDSEDNFRIYTYVKFKENIIEKLGLIINQRLLRNSPISFTGPGESPFFINSPDRRVSLVKVPFKPDVDPKIQKNGLDNLKTSIEEIINNSESLLKMVSTELEGIETYSKDALLRKRLQEQERQRVLELKRKEEEEKKKLEEKRKRYYKELYEDVCDYFLEISDICDDKKEIKSSFSNLSINLKFPLSKSKYGNNEPFSFDEKYEQVMKSLIQARKRINNKYKDVEIKLTFYNGFLIVDIFNDTINGSKTTDFFGYENDEDTGDFELLDDN